MIGKFRVPIDSNAQEQNDFLDFLSPRYIDWAIFGAAALSLFLELAIIRWQGTVFEFFAFYKNFSLLCCFAGLGLGYALADRRSIPLALTIPMLGWQFGLRWALAGRYRALWRSTWSVRCWVACSNITQCIWDSGLCTSWLWFFTRWHLCGTCRTGKHGKSLNCKRRHPPPSPAGNFETVGRSADGGFPQIVHPSRAWAVRRLKRKRQTPRTPSFWLQSSRPAFSQRLPSQPASRGGGAPRPATACKYR